MEDREIVELFFARDEQALKEVSRKYGSYCHSIADHILGNHSDAQECVNDTWMKAWNAIPPQKPENMSSFLGRIARNTALDRWRHETRQKRGGMNFDAVLDELSECVSGSSDPEGEVSRKLLAEEIGEFLRGLAKTDRVLFVLRYWHAYSIPEIAEKTGISENNISVRLSRVRGKLRTYLKKRGYDI